MRMYLKFSASGRWRWTTHHGWRSHGWHRTSAEISWRHSWWHSLHHTRWWTHHLSRSYLRWCSYLTTTDRCHICEKLCENEIESILNGSHGTREKYATVCENLRCCEGPPTPRTGPCKPAGTLDKFAGIPRPTARPIPETQPGNNS